jgi:hypothetical protein
VRHLTDLVRKPARVCVGLDQKETLVYTEKTKEDCISLTIDEAASLEQLLNGVEEALGGGECISKLGLGDLVAVECHHHGHRPFVESHFDLPMSTGFGVRIVTIQLQGPESTILIGNNGQFWSFKLESGQAYIRDGLARTICTHGVLVERATEHIWNQTQHGWCKDDRISMDLRLGQYNQPDAEEIQLQHMVCNVRIHDGEFAI